MPFYSAWAQKHHTVSGADVDLLDSDEDDFESLEDVSESEIEADEVVSTSIADQRKESDAIADKWFLYKVNFSAVAKEQNPTFDEAIVLKKRKRLPDGTYPVVRTYKLEVLYEHINILKWWKGNEKLFIRLQ